MDNIRYIRCSLQYLLLGSKCVCTTKNTGSSEINYWEISLHITRGFNTKIPRAMHAACSTHHEFSRYCNTEPRHAIISALTSLNLSFI